MNKVGIKVAKKGKNVSGSYDDLVFDTDTLSAMVVQAYQLYIPADPNWSYPDNSVFRKTIPHNLGYVPAIISFGKSSVSNDWSPGDAWLSWDDKNIYVKVGDVSPVNKVIYVLGVDIEKNYLGESIQNFTPFDKKDINIGIEANKHNRKTFTTSKKRLPISTIIANVSPIQELGFFVDPNNFFHFHHDIGKPVTFDLFGKYASDSSNLGNMVGKWGQLDQSPGSQIYSDNNIVTHNDASDDFSLETCLIYGTIK